jgi:hypothetical protein
MRDGDTRCLDSPPIYARDGALENIDAQHILGSYEMAELDLDVVRRPGGALPMPVLIDRGSDDPGADDPLVVMLSKQEEPIAGQDPSVVARAPGIFEHERVSRS